MLEEAEAVAIENIQLRRENEILRTRQTWLEARVHQLEVRLFGTTDVVTQPEGNKRPGPAPKRVPEPNAAAVERARRRRSKFREPVAAEVRWKR